MPVPIVYVWSYSSNKRLMVNVREENVCSFIKDNQLSDFI